jgi:hypothetical protein
MNLSELFGSNATVSAGTLQIDLSELATLHGFDGAIASITPSQIFSLLVKQAVTTTAEKTLDPAYGVTVARSFDSIVERGTDSHIGYGFAATLYAPNTAATLDPDSVI